MRRLSGLPKDAGIMREWKARSEKPAKREAAAGIQAPAGLRYEHLSGDEGQRTRILWEKVFAEDTEAFLDYYYENKIPEAQIHALCDGDGSIVSMVHLNPYEIACRVSGSKETEAHPQKAANRRMRRRTYYIVGVATAPEYRGRGCMAYLLEQAVLQARREGCPFLFLMPADPAIYEPFGFCYGYCHVLWERTQTLKRLMDAETAESVGRAGEAGAADGAMAAGGAGRAGEADAADGTEAEESAGTDGLAVTVYDKAEDADCLAAYAEKVLAGRYDTYCIHSAAYFERLSRELQSERGALYLIWERREGGRELCGYFGYAREGEEYLQEVVVSGRAEMLFCQKGQEERMMFLPLKDGVTYGRAYFPEIV